MNVHLTQRPQSRSVTPDRPAASPGAGTREQPGRSSGLGISRAWRSRGLTGPMEGFSLLPPGSTWAGTLEPSELLELRRSRLPHTPEAGANGEPQPRLGAPQQMRF